MEERGNLPPEVWIAHLYDRGMIEVEANSISDKAISANSLIATKAENCTRDAEKLVRARFHAIYISN